MTTSFRSPFTVIERLSGQWQNGRYYPNKDYSITKTVNMTVQEPSPGDMNAIEALPMGRRASRYIKVYADERLNPVSQEPAGAPGDVVLVDNKAFLVIGESNFTMLRLTRPNTSVAHYRYYCAEIVEADIAEALP